MNISLKNSLNQTVVLTGQESNYQVISVTGLDPGKAVINTTTIAGVDGTRFNSARLNNRNIVIMLKINGDADTNRQNLYQKFPLKEEVKITVTTNKTGTIKGHIDSISCNVFDQKQIMQISVLCDDPYFYGTDYVKTETWDAENEDPHSLAVTNSGEVGTGFSLEIDYDGQFMGIDISNDTGHLNFLFSSAASIGKFIIDTVEGTAVMQSNGQTVDILQYLQYGSTFPKLPAGNSSVLITLVEANTTDLTAKITIPVKFGGM